MSYDSGKEACCLDRVSMATSLQLDLSIAKQLQHARILACSCLQQHTCKRTMSVLYPGSSVRLCRRSLRGPIALRSTAGTAGPASGAAAGGSGRCLPGDPAAAAEGPACCLPAVSAAGTVVVGSTGGSPAGRQGRLTRLALHGVPLLLHQLTHLSFSTGVACACSGEAAAVSMQAWASATARRLTRWVR